MVRVQSAGWFFFLFYSFAYAQPISPVHLPPCPALSSEFPIRSQRTSVIPLVQEMRTRVDALTQSQLRGPLPSPPGMLQALSDSFERQIRNANLSQAPLEAWGLQLTWRGQDHIGTVSGPTIHGIFNGAPRVPGAQNWNHFRSHIHACQLERFSEGRPCGIGYLFDFSDSGYWMHRILRQALLILECPHPEQLAQGNAERTLMMNLSLRRNPILQYNFGGEEVEPVSTPEWFRMGDFGAWLLDRIANSGVEALQQFSITNGHREFLRRPMVLPSATAGAQQPTQLSIQPTSEAVLAIEGQEQEPARVSEIDATIRTAGPDSCSDLHALTPRLAAGSTQAFTEISGNDNLNRILSGAPFVYGSQSNERFRNLIPRGGDTLRLVRPSDRRAILREFANNFDLEIGGVSINRGEPRLTQVNGVTGIDIPLDISSVATFGPNGQRLIHADLRRCAVNYRAGMDSCQGRRFVLDFRNSHFDFTQYINAIVIDFCENNGLLIRRSYILRGEATSIPILANASRVTAFIERFAENLTRTFTNSLAHRVGEQNQTAYNHRVAVYFNDAELRRAARTANMLNEIAAGAPHRIAVDSNAAASAVVSRQTLCSDAARERASMAVLEASLRAHPECLVPLRNASSLYLSTFQMVKRGRGVWDEDPSALLQNFMHRLVYDLPPGFRERLETARRSPDAALRTSWQNDVLANSQIRERFNSLCLSLGRHAPVAARRNTTIQDWLDNGRLVCDPCGQQDGGCPLILGPQRNPSRADEGRLNWSLSAGRRLHNIHILADAFHSGGAHQETAWTSHVFIHPFSIHGNVSVPDFSRFTLQYFFEHGNANCSDLIPLRPLE